MTLKCCFSLLTLQLVWSVSYGQQDIFFDTKMGSYLRDPTLQSDVKWTPEASVATVTALLGVPPLGLTNRETSDQVEKLLSPSPFSRPKSIFSLALHGTSEGALQTPETLSKFANGRPYHVMTRSGGNPGENLTKLGALLSLHSEESAHLHEHLNLDCALDEHLEKSLHGMAEHIGGTYEPAAKPMRGKIHFGEGAKQTLDLNRTEAERKLAIEVACLSQKVSSLIASGELPRLVTGSLNSLAMLRDAHGPASDIFAVGSHFMVDALQQVLISTAAANNDDLVSQLSLISQSSASEEKVSRRKLLQSEDKSRDVNAWQSQFMMLSVFFLLFIVLSIVICCMFDMEFKQDTLLYGSSKKSD